MGSSLSRGILAPTITAAILTACVGSGSVPNASSLGAAQNRFSQEADGVALSGEYAGKYHDSVHGTLNIKAFFSQSQSALGGVLVNDGGSQGPVAIIAWNASARTIVGNDLGPAATGSNLCTFSMIGKYKYRRLSGSYSATHGCSGETGTFTLWHRCYFKGMESDAIRPEIRLKPCTVFG
jgi:hypothetical protein